MAREGELERIFLELEEKIADGAAPDIEGACEEHAEIAAELRALWDIRRRLDEHRRDLESNEPRTDGRVWLSWLRGLRHPQAREARYEREARVGSGASSEVYRVRDLELPRRVAMKRARTSVDGTNGAGSDDHRWLRRLLSEARITARLDHPCIVPIHDIGLDSNGHFYFTMRLVSGVSFSHALELAAKNEDGWDEFRALEVLLRVCEALDYAHSTGVIHRDLKPDNILVGRFGEVYVVDWGLARALHDHPNAEPFPTSEADAAIAAALTGHGEIVGTPSYMAPEQALGHFDDVDARSDVYSIGAVLYQLLSGRAPYSERGVTADFRAVLEHVKNGPPRPLSEIAPRAPRKLAAVCAKAMARDKKLRYASTGALADDVRRYLSGRVVRAYEEGTWAEVKSSLRRNKIAAVLGVATLVSIAGGSVVAAGWQGRARHASEVQACAGELVDLVRRAERLWPASDAISDDLEKWLDDAASLRPKLTDLRAELERVRASALPFEPDSADEVAARQRRDDRRFALMQQRDGDRLELMQLADQPDHPGRPTREQFLRARIGEMEKELAELEESHTSKARATWSFADDEQQGRHDFLARLVADLDQFFHPDARRGVYASVEQRLVTARDLTANTIDGPSDAWKDARAAIAASPHYGGLDLRPQVGLLPLGEDRHSGLWEFALWTSGVSPQRGADGALAIDASSALVLVLVPGGRFARSLTGPPPPAPDEASIEASFRRRVAPGQADCVLDPFFLSKYEMSQAQWIRLTGQNPSYFHDGATFQCVPCVATWPVENVAWDEAVRWLPHWGLELPTEAQWEHAARAGAPTPIWWGSDLRASAGRANLDGVEDSSSGLFAYFAPIDALQPNPFGLHQVIGNVWELCADEFWVSWSFPMRDGDGLQSAPESGLRVARGGSRFYKLDAPEDISFLRTDNPPSRPNGELGVRPMRRIGP